MTNAKREEIIAAMSSLLEQLDYSELPKAEPTNAVPEKVEMLTIKKCTEAVKGAERVHSATAYRPQGNPLNQNGTG